MRPQRAQGKIRPKVSSMPRQRSEAAAYLDIYKLAIEKERLQRELNSLELRSVQIKERLGVLETQVGELERTAQVERTAAPRPTAVPLSGDYETLLFDY